MVARRDFLIPVHVGGLVPILFADDSLCHAFTPSVTSYHTPPTGDHKGPPCLPSSALAPTRDPSPGLGMATASPPRAATRAPTPLPPLRATCCLAWARQGHPLKARPLVTITIKYKW